MAVTLKQVAVHIREILGNPLPQAPTYSEIMSEMEAEYQFMTNIGNNLGVAWATSSFTIDSVAGQRVYEITTSQATDFYKALKVLTVPDNTALDPEYQLEFVEVEHFSNEWAWLSENQGQLWHSSHDSQLVAFYRTMGANGEQVYMELRPVPSEVQTYKVLYMQGDWWNKAVAKGDAYTLPHAVHARYLELLCAQNLLSRSKWCYDDRINQQMKKDLAMDIRERLPRAEELFKSHIATLESQDLVYLDRWSDEQNVLW